MTNYYSGIDLAVKGDFSAVIVCHKISDGTIIIDDEGISNDPVEFKNIIRKFELKYSLNNKLYNQLDLNRLKQKFIIPLGYENLFNSRRTK